MRGSVLYVVGAVLGVAVIWLGVLITNPRRLVDPANPLGVFSTMGAILVLAGVSAILVGVGRSLQTWGGRAHPRARPRGVTAGGSFLNLSRTPGDPFIRASGNG